METENSLPEFTGLFAWARWWAVLLRGVVAIVASFRVGGFCVARSDGPPRAGAAVRVLRAVRGASCNRAAAVFPFLS